MIALLLALAAGPNLTLTPGVVRPLSTQTVCATKWGLDRRHVTLTMKHHVFAAYGIPWAQHARYETDHLISRELGGADDERNLWPQLYTGPWNAHVKDRLENRLHREVCAGRLTLTAAQQAIRTDWIAAARRFGIQ